MCLEVLAEVHLPHERRRRGWLRPAKVPATGPGRYCSKGERAFRRGSLITRRSHQLACTHICGVVGGEEGFEKGEKGEEEAPGRDTWPSGRAGCLSGSGGAEGSLQGNYGVSGSF